MNRVGKERATQVERPRAHRWQFVAAAALFLAACARWPLAGESMTAATSQAVPDAAHGASNTSAGIVATYADADGLRRPGIAPGLRGKRGAGGAIQRPGFDVDARSVAAASTANDGAISPLIVDEAAPGVSTDVGHGAVVSSSRSGTQAGAEVSDIALDSAAAAIAPPVEGGMFGQGHRRATRWLAGIAAMLLLLFIVGRRKRRPRRIRKMNTQRTESTTPRIPMPAQKKRATEKPRVRMFSALEIYAPTHESHRGPWEAPVTTERGFAHRYEVGAQVGDGLLFVPEPEAHAVDVKWPSQPHAEQPGPTSFISPVMPMPSDTPPPTVPLVFSAAAVEPSRRAEASIERHAPAEPDVVHGAQPAAARLEEASIPTTEAYGTIGAERSDTPDEQGPSAKSATFIAPAELRAKPDVRSLAEAVRSGGTTLLDPAELFSSASPKPGTEVPNAASAPALPPAPAPSVPPLDPVVEARMLVESGDHVAALKHLEIAMRSTRPPEDAWRLAALCWWQIARADGGPEAYANAADAMDHLLERDPSQAELWYRAGTCRLLQASDERGQAQRATLDLAVAALNRAVAEGERDDPLHATTLGDALFARALAATDELSAARAKRLAAAVQVLRDAARGARDPSSMAAWKLQQALQAQAGLASGTEASGLRMEAEAVLAAGVENAAAQERVAWVTAQVENELAHAELAQGATRTLHLRTFRDSHRDLLTGPDAAPELLLSWLELLALETGHLRGDAASSRFDEGEAILQRLDAALPGNAHVALARARLLHRRAAQSNGVSRHAVLSDAIAGLMAIVERGDAPQLQIEVAELLLDRAAGAPSMQAGEDCARAEAMASGLLDHPVFALAAARCVVQARLRQSSGAIEPAVCRRLEALAGDDVRSRWLLAQAALRAGAPREACGHCEAGARSGIRLDQAFVQLWDQASRQWSAALHNPKDPAWLANRQRLRSAG